MALGNYNDLQAAVKAWAARGDMNFGSNVPEFIVLAEERIWKNLRCSHMLSAPTVLNIPDGLNYVPLPADWLGFERLVNPSANDGEDLVYQPQSTLSTLGPTGDGSVYSLEGRYLYYGQAGMSPGGTDLTTLYYKHPGALSAVSTTWLLTFFPTVYLMGALWAGAVFLKNTQKAAEYDRFFINAIEGIYSQDRAAMISGGRLRRRGPGLT